VTLFIKSVIPQKLVGGFSWNSSPEGFTFTQGTGISSLDGGSELSILHIHVAFGSYVGRRF